MFNLLKLQQERAHKAMLAKDMVERAEKDAAGPRPMNQDELDLFDKLTNEIKALDSQISSIAEHEKRREESAKLVDELNEPAGRQSVPTVPTVASSTFKIPATAKRTSSLKAFKGPNAEMNAYRSGMWARATLFGDQRAAHYCVNNGIQIQNALSTTSNPDGGFLVPEEFAQSIIDLREMYGVFRRECRVWAMGRDTMLIPRRLTGITIGPVGENPTSAITQSTPTWNQVMLTAKKVGGLSLMSTEIAEDAVIDLADYLANEFAYSFANFEDTIGFTGAGSQAHLGVRGLTDIFVESASLAGGVLATAGEDTFAEVTAGSLAKLMAALPEYATPNAKFYCSRVAAELVFGRLQAGAGGNTIGTLSGDRVGRSYLGYPIVVSQVLPSSQTALTDGSSMLFFGDLTKSSSMGDRREVRVFPSEHRYMDTDQIGIRGTERIDIVNHDYGTTSVAGPIVALLANAS